MGQLGRQNAPQPFDVYKKDEIDAIEAAQDAANTAVNDAQDTAISNAAVPVGQIIYHAGTTPPTGFLACDGSELSETTYADLFASIGTAWNTTGGVAAPTAGNFRLPPSEIGGLGLYMRGVGATNGVVGTYQADVFKSHNHSVLGGTGTASPNSGKYGEWPTSTSWRSNGVSNTGDATETRPRSITVLMCIKY